MLIFDEKTLEPISGVNDGDGRFYSAVMEFLASYKVIEQAVTEREVVAEYPNGGKEVRTVIVSPEVGEWLVTGPNGDDLTGLVEVPENVKSAKSTEPMPFSCEVEIFHQWTAEELEENRRNDENRAVFGEMAESFPLMDDAICDLYETTLCLDAIIDEQDAAICALYEMMEA